MQTTITIKTDKKLRDAAKKTAAALGIPLTTVINAQLREFVRAQRFEISLTPRPGKIAEWKKMSDYANAHPESETALRTPEEVQKYFRSLIRTTRKK
ncbi:MAG: hypothetical protein JWN64_464 [Parcubacteria group bacterium]|nr:hypothetical protein [Parcubacteria group bacterium]